MIYLNLFWVFLKIGMFTIGGHYAMLPLIRDEVVTNRGWVDANFFLDFVGIAESTPGPFALNIATFVGFEQAGLLGALTATLGLILPAFVIILIIAKLFISFGDNKYVKRIFWGFKPVVVALILSAAVTMFLQVVLPNFKIKDFMFDLSAANLWGLLVLTIVLVFSRIKIKKRTPHPVLAILLSASLGIVIKGVILQ